MTELPKVIVLDDDMQLLKALHRMLTHHAFRVELFDCPEEFLTHVSENASADTRADAIVLDVGMKGLNGLEVQAALNHAGSTTPIIFMSGEVDLKGMNTAWREGAFDFLLKPFTSEELLGVLRRAISRKSSPNADPTALATRVDAGKIQRLTPRELEVFRDIVKGAKNAETATSLGITERTVKLHRKNIRKKLGIYKVADLVRYYDLHRDMLT